MSDVLRTIKSTTCFERAWRAWGAVHARLVTVYPRAPERLEFSVEWSTRPCVFLGEPRIREAPGPAIRRAPIVGRSQTRRRGARNNRKGRVCGYSYVPSSTKNHPPRTRSLARTRRARTGLSVVPCRHGSGERSAPRCARSCANEGHSRSTSSSIFFDSMTFRTWSY